MSTKVETQGHLDFTNNKLKVDRKKFFIYVFYQLNPLWWHLGMPKALVEQVATANQGGDTNLAKPVIF